LFHESIKASQDVGRAASVQSSTFSFLTAIISDDDWVQRQRVSANHDVEVPHRLSLAFSPKMAVLLSGLRIPRQDRNAQKEVFDQCP
jgi:hypothetical protein